MSTLLPSVIQAEPTLEDRIRASIMAPLVADALSLATHYGLGHILLMNIRSQNRIRMSQISFIFIFLTRWQSTMLLK